MEKVILFASLMSCGTLLATVLCIEVTRIYKRNKRLKRYLNRKQWVRCNTIDGIKWYEREKMKPTINRYGKWYSFSHKYYNDIV